MEMLRATYGSDSEEDDADDSAAAPPIVGSRSSSGSSRSKADSVNGRSNLEQLDPLPPPPLDLLQSPILSVFLDFSSTTQGSRIRSFPHVEGNYALHVYVPVVIPTTMKMPVALFVKRIASLVPGLYAVDIDYPLAELCRDDLKLEQMLLGREFHVSLGRTVPIKVHQIDSIVAMLRQKFQSQRRYRVEFNKWDVFVNDEQTRSFLALEVLGGGLSEITKQIHIVDVIYRLHGLPEFYKNPRPHISLLWGLGDMSDGLKQGIEEIDRSYKNASLSCGGHIFTCKTSGIECKIGKKTYSICKFLD
ncbi:unnamed protein product [Musa acuminata subsp. malaccensis]|uniref:U6 snRNA phosphodiesterase n=1 Tax=Musa acuminata subsp. malaccensis TaxID=214687 RepID=A0A8D7ATD6_MUSAM|nr:unnamed protein product [Musa acuminata subsp. malaccensis]